MTPPCRLKTAVAAVLIIPLFFWAPPPVRGLDEEGPVLNGSIDFAYNYNFNKRPTNSLRLFDANANSLTLQNAEISYRNIAEKGLIYQVDVTYGYDAVHTQADGFKTGAGSLQTDLQQAHLTFPCPLITGRVTVGKFVTPFGAEMIDAKDNINISRGFLFNYALPRTHTGLKWTKVWNEHLTVSAGAVNGWDNLQDNNRGKSGFGQINLTPAQSFSLTVGGIYGPEQPTATPSIEKNARSLVDTLCTIRPTESITLIVNHDWGVEEGLAPAGTDTTQNWQGVGVHLTYAFSESTAAGARWENFDDEGARTGTAQVLNEVTTTLQYKHNSVIYRLEYRQDMSNKNSFLDENGAPDDVQSTVGAQIVYAF